ncbi:hypothetical protein ACFOLK_09620 [Marinococcus halophilus]|uniref:Uncharacterized protein n=1 Tax=Marinococcus halophilus TaxID=1371 RepID=A0A510Y628_MARHA|nr:hypothetical protein [Marinococcus halophilus]GEK58171.1 hypothetical protein MHA01_10760 [Marinococcus halophilus]
MAAHQFKTRKQGRAGGTYEFDGTPKTSGIMFPPLPSIKDTIY